MESPRPGDLVTVTSGSAALPAIVFDVPSAGKVVVAVVDRGRGPVLRTFSAAALAERTQEDPADRALRLLIRRTPPPAGATGRDGAGAGQRRSGHTRATMHRTTGR